MYFRIFFVRIMSIIILQPWQYLESPYKNLLCVASEIGIKGHKPQFVANMEGDKL